MSPYLDHAIERYRHALGVVEPPSPALIAAAERLKLDWERLARATPTKAFHKIAMALRRFRRHPTPRGQRVHERRRKAAERRRG